MRYRFIAAVRPLAFAASLAACWAVSGCGPDKGTGEVPAEDLDQQLGEIEDMYGNAEGDPGASP